MSELGTLAEAVRRTGKDYRTLTGWIKSGDLTPVTVEDPYAYTGGRRAGRKPVIVDLEQADRLSAEKDARNTRLIESPTDRNIRETAEDTRPRPGIHIGLSDAGRKHGVSKQRIDYWAKTGKVTRYDDGTVDDLTVWAMVDKLSATSPLPSPPHVPAPARTQAARVTGRSKSPARAVTPPSPSPSADGRRTYRTDELVSDYLSFRRSRVMHNTLSEDERQCRAFERAVRSWPWTKNDLRHYVDGLTGTGSTRAKRCKVITTFQNWVSEYYGQDYYGPGQHWSPPTFKGLRPENDTEQPDVLTREQETAILAELGRRGGAIFAICELVRRGARPFQVSGLDWDDVDYYEESGVYGFTTTRRTTKHGHFVSFGPDLYAYMRKINPSGVGPVFVTKYGNRWTTDAIRNEFRKAVEDAGLSGAIAMNGPYILRHTVSQRLKEEEGLEAEAEMMGHSVKMAERIYGKHPKKVLAKRSAAVHAKLFEPIQVDGVQGTLIEEVA